MSAAAQPAELLRHLDVATASFAERLRRRSVSWWSAPSAVPGWSRADLVAHLVASYATWEQSLTSRPGPVVPQRPDCDDVLADQYAVTARELLGALPGAPPDLIETVLAETRRRRFELDGTLS